MPRRIDLSIAQGMLRSRDELIATGWTERMLREQVARGEIIRVHRGCYVDGREWAQLWPEGRHLLQVLSVQRAARDDGPVFSHTSAAVLWGLPLYRVDPADVHTVIDGRRHTRTAAGVRRHDMQLD